MSCNRRRVVIVLWFWLFVGEVEGLNASSSRHKAKDTLLALRASTVCAQYKAQICYNCTGSSAVKHFIAVVRRRRPRTTTRKMRTRKLVQSFSSREKEIARTEGNRVQNGASWFSRTIPKSGETLRLMINGGIRARKIQRTKP